MSRTTKPAGRSAGTTPVQVQISGDSTPDIAAYAERRLREALRSSRRPVLHARLRLTRYADPALARPVVAQANLDVNGRFVRAQLRAPTAREAVDLLHDRLRRRLEHDVARADGDWEDRRGRRTSAQPHEWRHADEPTPRPPYFPRAAEDREIVRRKSVPVARCGIDQAAADMADLDYGFHLFTEAGTGQDSVLYRSGPTGYRVAQLLPEPEALLAAHTLPVTISERPAPRLSVEEAAARMAADQRPFLFFRDQERGRGALLYHRYDGHYGLVEPTGTGEGARP